MSGKQFVNNQNVVAVDWNGVMDMYEGYRGPDYMYPPRPGLKQFLVDLKRLGYRVIIFTAADLGTVRKWLEKYDLSYLVEDVTDKKIPAIVYLDDRAVTFNGNFDDAVKDIVNFAPHRGGNT